MRWVWIALYLLVLAPLLIFIFGEVSVYFGVEFFIALFVGTALIFTLLLFHHKYRPLPLWQNILFFSVFVSFAIPVWLGSNVYIIGPLGWILIFISIVFLPLYFANTALTPFRKRIAKIVAAIVLVSVLGIYQTAILVFCGSPLHCAAVAGNVPIVKALLWAGFDTEKRMHEFTTPSNHPGFTVLERLSGTNNLEMISLIIDHGADIQGQYIWKNAISSGKEETIELLLESGVDPNFPKDFQLLFAVLSQVQREGWSPETIELLIKHGAAVNVRVRPNAKQVEKENTETATPLYVAVQYNWKSTAKQLRSIEILLQHGANPYDVVFGHTVMEYAKSKEKPASPAIIELLERYADNRNFTDSSTVE